MRTITRQEIEKAEIKQDRLVICGAGHVALAVIKLGKLLGFSITVIEDRPLFANQAREILREGTDSQNSMNKNEVICEAFEKALSREKGSAQTYFVIVTRGHRYDLECLRSILKKSYAYVGMMGSRGRAGRIRQLLLEEGFPGESVDTLHSPIGLAIDAKTPEEIAVSILSEIIQVRNSQKPVGKENSDDSGRTKGDGNFPCQIELTDELRTAALEESETRRVFAVITARKGSAPRTVGTAMVIFQDGRTAGTIGGGCMEAEVVKVAHFRLNIETEEEILMRRKSNTPDIMKVHLLPEEAETEGMACGGIMDVELIEILNK